MRGWTKAVLFGAGIGLVAVLYHRAERPSARLLFITDTHGAAARNRALAEALRRESNVCLILHGGDVADAPDLYRPWWDVPFAGLPAPVAAVTGNHDTRAEVERRFGAVSEVRRCPGVDVFLLPWGWGDAEAAAFNEAVAASTARHRIVVTHRRLFPGTAWKKLLPGLLRVNLVLAGHDHVYWNQTFDVGGGHRIRQIIEVSGPKKYDCDPAWSGCAAGTTGYLRINVGRSLQVERVVVP